MTNRKVSREEMWEKPFIGTYHNGNGITIRFKNGHSLSIIFGSGSYSACRDSGALEARDDYRSKFCRTAEIQISGPKKCVSKSSNNKLEGWQTPDQLAKIIACVAKARKRRKKR